MVMPIVPKPLFPFVPNLPGIPAVLRDKAASLDIFTLNLLGISDALGNIIGTGLDPWGIFDENGDSIADYDSIYSLDYDNQTRISDYPVENGGFESYNKVNNPYDSFIVINCGGSAARRSACLTSINTAKDSTNLYSVLTPSDAILDAMVLGYSYSARAEEGATLLTIRITLREVRETAKGKLAEPKTPNAFLPQAQGQIQTVDDPKIDFSGFA